MGSSPDKGLAVNLAGVVASGVEVDLAAVAVAAAPVKVVRDQDFPDQEGWP